MDVATKTRTIEQDVTLLLKSRGNGSDGNCWCNHFTATPAMKEGSKQRHAMKDVLG